MPTAITAAETAATGPVRDGAPAVPSAPGLWRQTGLLIQWQLRRCLPMMPLLMIVQALLSVSTILGYGLVAGDPGPEASLYLATGAPAISLVVLGLAMTPQWVSQSRTEGSLAGHDVPLREVGAQSRTEGSLDWMRTLPVPRIAFLLADLTLWTVLALPGLVLGVAVGSARFDVSLSPAWWLVPGAVLVALTAACLGYAIANLLTPSLAQIVSQVLIFVIMLFSPFSYPASQLPGWARTVHEWLPFEPMAQVVRAGLCSQDAVMPARAWVVLGVWSAASLAGASWALGRRS